VYALCVQAPTAYAQINKLLASALPPCTNGFLSNAGVARIICSIARLSATLSCIRARTSPFESLPFRKISGRADGLKNHLFFCAYAFPAKAK